MAKKGRTFAVRATSRKAHTRKVAGKAKKVKVQGAQVKSYWRHIPAKYKR